MNIKMLFTGAFIREFYISTRFVGSFDQKTLNLPWLGIVIVCILNTCFSFPQSAVA